MSKVIDQHAELEDILSHVPEEFDDKIKEFATNGVLLRSRYLFVRRENDRRIGFCTHCRHEHDYEDAVKHHQSIRCQQCNSLCTMKQIGRGRKHLLDDGYFVYFSKSIKDPDTIIARGIYVQRDYSGDYEKVETAYVVTAAYVFGGGKARMVNRSYWWSNDNWYIRKKIYAEADSTFLNKQCSISYESIREAVANTPFQYSAWDRYPINENLLLFFAEAAKYPCVEYLTKLGLQDFVKDKMYGNRTFGAINWRGKTLDAVLKVSKQDLKGIRDAEHPISLLTLRLFQMAKIEGLKFSLREAYRLSNMIDGKHGFDDFRKLNKFAKINEIKNYVEKQFLRKNNNRYSTGSGVLIAWRDYLDDCMQLEMNVQEESVLFPTDLHRAHQQTIKKVKLKADEALSKRIQERLRRLEKYKFEDRGLFIRAAFDSAELIHEGNVLKHCVGGYADRYARGETDLFVIRKVDSPETPFFTVEIRKGEIVQARGSRNCSPTKEVKAFIDAFKTVKLKKSTKRKGVAV